VAGNGIQGYSGDGGPATSASLNMPAHVAVDVSGNIYIAENRNRIRMVTKSTGIITTVAGDGTYIYSGDGGPAIYAGLRFTGGIAVDASGNIYIADLGAHRVRMVTKSTGIITTVAGDGTRGYSGDGGPATSAILDSPNSVAFDASENMYILVENRIRIVTKSTGIITTVAGDGTNGYAGDGGLATSAGLTGPFGIAVDASGNIYIADSLSDRIRMVTKSTGIITTVAGNGIRGYAGDGGPATSAGLYYPNCIAVDASGNIYFQDGSTNRVRKVTKSSGIITTVAGNGIQGYSGDGGPATSASFDAPYGLAVDASGTIYIPDIINHRVRIVSY
jgi:trimeric autotransporter adhesin